MGFKPSTDLNGADSEGIGIYQINTRGGWRASTANAFLYPARSRKTLKIETHSLATKILIEGKRAVVTGGGMDALTRTLSLGLTDTLGQNVVVDNRPGAGSQLALQVLANAAPDLVRALVHNAIQEAAKKGSGYETAEGLAVTLLLISGGVGALGGLMGLISPMRKSA